MNIEMIRAAKTRLEGNARRTPLLNSPFLDEIAGRRVLIKPECLQVTGSFKYRGARNAVAALDPEVRARGVIAFSSGIAGAFAFVRSDLSASLSGVAVSASLLPPLCATGIGTVLRDAALVKGAIFIFLLNVVGIIIASAFVFWQLGFREARSVEVKEVEKAEGGGRD